MGDVCLIWENGFVANRTPLQSRLATRVEECSRVDGGYTIGHLVATEAQALDDKGKARLTTWIVDQHAFGDRHPEVTHAIVERARNGQSLPTYERAKRLLQFIARECGTVGVAFDTRPENLGAYAWSESTSKSEIAYFIGFLLTKGWLDAPQGIAYRLVDRHSVPAIVMVTVEGHSQIAAQQVNADKSQAFVAMWFDDSMNEVRNKGIMQGIVDAGYKAYVVDEDEHIGKIDDKIIAEIRRSRFIVADFTHGDKGARGGVYFEAGFGLGLGIPVIYTCHKGQMSDVHFDTQHYNHILWEKPEELREALANRIRAVLGQGPEALP